MKKLPLDLIIWGSDIISHFYVLELRVCSFLLEIRHILLKELKHMFNNNLKPMLKWNLIVYS